MALSAVRQSGMSSKLNAVALIAANVWSDEQKCS